MHLGDAAAAKMHYQRALSLHPNHPASLLAMARLAMQDGKTDEANTIRLTLKEINPALLDSDAASTKQD